MKRIALAVLTVALVLSLLVGCVVPVTQTATPSPTVTSASPTLTPTPTSDVIVGVWEELSFDGGDVNSLVIDPSNPQTLYARTGGGVWKSNDGGTSWVDSSLGLTGGAMGLVIDPSNPQTLYVYVRTVGGGIGGVFKSSDGGASWAASSLGLPNIVIGPLVFDPSNPRTRYANTTGGVYKSNDGGNSWVASSSGLPSDSDVLWLAIDPSGTLYAGTNSGLFRMTPQQ